MGGRVLLLCAGDQQRWQMSVPKQLLRVENDEILLARTVRQCSSRFSGDDPLIISHLPSLRSFSRNAIMPRCRRYITETLLTSFPFWGEQWTIALLGDVFFTDELMDTIIRERNNQDYRFYGTEQEIFALSFTDYQFIARMLDLVVCYANQGRCKGKLWDLYYALSGVSVEQSGDGRVLLDEKYDEQHFCTVGDGSCDFDSLEQYSQWHRNYLRNEVRL